MINLYGDKKINVLSSIGEGRSNVPILCYGHSIIDYLY